MKSQLFRTGIRLAICIMMLLTTATSALAADNTSSSASPTEKQEADDGALEVGVWYVQDYENCGGWGLGDLSATAPDALGLRNGLQKYWYREPFTIFGITIIPGQPYPGAQWSTPLTWGNGSAWQKDWTRPAVGGWDDSEADSVDLAYFSGHGASSGFFFGVGGNNKNGCQVTKNDTAGAWGTADNDWIGISACNVLDDPFSNIQGWANSMNGTRLLMGFQTVMADVDFGVPLANEIRWNHSMTYAWFKAADLKLPGWQVARILAEDNSYFGDRWWNHNSPTVVDNTFWWWTHQTGQNNLPPSLVAAGVDQADKINRLMETGMPVMLVKPLSLDAAKSEYNNIAQAFALTDTAPITTSVNASGAAAVDDSTFTSANGDLVMDANAGNFFYGNSDTLWNTQQAIQAASSTGLLEVTDDVAKQVAEQFLNSNNLKPSDAVFNTVVNDVITQGQDPTRHQAVSSAGASSMQIVSEDIANKQVVYSRVLSATVGATASSAGEAMNFEVEGPGAKLKVFVPGQISADAMASATLADNVLGGMGGYREVEQASVNVAGVNEPLVTMPLPFATIKTLFNKLEKNVAIDYVPLPAVSKTISDVYDLTYYEGPIGFSQAKLLEIYKLNVTAVLSDNTSQTYKVYIPINEKDMSPYARINVPAGIENAKPGTVVTLDAADASKTLKENGVDDSLDFVLGSGGDYLYEWYLDNAETGPKVGTGRSISFTVPFADGVGPDKAASYKVVLKVTDADNQNGNRSATDEFSVSNNQLVPAGKIYLPAVQK
ncbi:MAG: DUF6345 domain-containing protein [Caldilineaceae bacterium]